MPREMLINVAEKEECRVAVVEDGALEELYVERLGLGSHVGNIYKGKVINVEPGIQAAFVDFGIGRNGFLHVSDLHPKYFGGETPDVAESIGRRKALRERPPIQSSLRRGDELIVQVTKEGINTKGPTLSTYVALPGKFLVMMPWMKHCGVSHKIEDVEERTRLRQILEECKPPAEQGFIIRTAGQGCSKKDIQNDLRYLERLWTAIDKRMQKEKAPAELYQESDLVIRTLRDVYTPAVTKIICDSEGIVRKIKDFLYIAMSRVKAQIVLYDGKVPLFHKYKIEDEIAKIQSRKVNMKGGGSIAIEQTEALVAIDVNSGRYHDQQNAEQTAFKTNQEAAVEIARQLRLRDLGGLIICDFIDMRSEKHRKEIERVFRNAVKTDRARCRILKISRFGVVEMTRQRMRPSLQTSTSLTCSHCNGTGFVKSHESLALELIRLLNFHAAKTNVKQIELSVSMEVADYLQNEKRASIMQIEQQSNKRIIVHGKSDYTGEKYSFTCYDDRGTAEQ